MLLSVAADQAAARWSVEGQGLAVVAPDGVVERVVELVVAVVVGRRVSRGVKTYTTSCEEKRRDETRREEQNRGGCGGQ